MNILITGITGHIGSFLADYLSAQHKIFGIAREANKPNHFVFDLLPGKQEELDTILENNQIELVIHCAANKKPTTMDDLYLNSLALNKFLVSPVGKKIRYIVIGSAAEYGLGNPETNLITEETLPVPDSLYGVSKFFQTTLANYYHNLDYKITVLRLFNIISPSAEPGTFVGNVFTEIEKGEAGKITINNSKVERDFIDIRDFADLVKQVVETPPKSFLYNVGTGNNVSYGDFINETLKLLQAADLPQPKVIDKGQPEKFHQAKCGNNKIKTEYNWAPQFTLKDSVAWCLKERGLINS